MACEKESAVFKTEKIKDYFPLKVGNYINYRLDSTVYLSLGTKKRSTPTSSRIRLIHSSRITWEGHLIRSKEPSEAVRIPQNGKT